MDFDLNAPFTSLRKISETVDSQMHWSKSSKWIQLGAFAKMDRLTALSGGFLFVIVEIWSNWRDLVQISNFILRYEFESP